MSSQSSSQGAIAAILSPQRFALLLIACMSTLGSRPARAEFTVLHSFGQDNSSPFPLVVSSTGQLVGATQFGTSNVGTLFTMNLNGGNYQTIHTFSGGPADGAFP